MGSVQVTAGAASAAVGSAASATAGSRKAMAAATTAEALAAGAEAVVAGWGNVMASTALTSMAGTGAVSVIDNKGNLGGAFKDTFSADSLKNAAIGGLTAGAISYVDSNWLQAPSGATNGGSQVTGSGPDQNPGYSKDMLSWSNAEQTVLSSGTHALINSGVSTGINGARASQSFVFKSTSTNVAVLSMRGKVLHISYPAS